MYHTFLLGYNIGFTIEDMKLYGDCSKIFSKTSDDQLIINIVCKLQNDVVYFIKDNKMVSKQSRRVWISRLLRYYHQLIYDVYNESYILFHASCIERKGKTIAIAGASKSGKSTCLYNMMSEGSNFVTDDMVLVNKDNCMIMPSPKTITKLRYGVENCVEVNDTGDISKIYLYSFYMNGYKIQTEPQKLDKIIYIKYVPDADNKVVYLNRIEAIDKISKNIFNIGVIKMDDLVNMVSSVEESIFCQYSGDVQLIKNIIDN